MWTEASRKKIEDLLREGKESTFNVTFGLCTHKMMIIIIFILNDTPKKTFFFVISHLLLSSTYFTIEILFLTKYILLVDVHTHVGHESLLLFDWQKNMCMCLSLCIIFLGFPFHSCVEIFRWIVWPGPEAIQENHSRVNNVNTLRIHSVNAHRIRFHEGRNFHNSYNKKLITLTFLRQYLVSK